MVSQLPKRMKHSAWKTTRLAADKVVRNIKSQIKKQDLIASHEMIDSTGRRKIPGMGYRVFVDAPHARHVEYGTRPHTPPFQPLLDWAVAKGFRDPHAVAAAVVRKITKEGTKPTHFTRIAIDRALKRKRSYIPRLFRNLMKQSARTGL